MVTIRVEDVNDNPPAFESDKLTLYIDENSPVGSTVGELHAKDPDEGQNAVVQYSIIGQSSCLIIFSIRLSFFEVITVEITFKSLYIFLANL